MNLVEIIYNLPNLTIKGRTYLKVELENLIYQWVFLSPTDGDCGRGFVRIENVCFNLSYTQSQPSDVLATCQTIQTQPLNETSTGILQLLKV